MRCPQRLVCTWSSMCIPATPALTYCLTVRATFAGPPKLRRIISTKCKTRQGDRLPCIGVCDHRDGRLQAANHLRSLLREDEIMQIVSITKSTHPDKVVERGNSHIWLAKA